MEDNFTQEEIDYLLMRFNQAKYGKTHLVTPEYMEDLERRRLERQKQKLGLLNKNK